VQERQLVGFDRVPRCELRPFGGCHDLFWLAEIGILRHSGKTEGS